MLRKLIIALSAAFFACAPANAQTGSAKTPAALNTEVNSLWADQNAGGITPFNARQTLLDIVASYPSIINGLCTTSGAFPIYNATSATWVCSTVGGAGSLATLSGYLVANITPSTLPPGNIFNSFSINNDNLDAGAGFMLGARRFYTFGGSNTKGSRIAGYDFVANTAITSATNLNRAYVGTVSIAYTNFGDGGTNTGAGAKGGYFGANQICQLDTGGVNVNECTGNEIDVQATASSSVKYNRNLSLVNFSAIHGSQIDSAITFSGGGGSLGGWNNPILFTDVNRGTTESPVNSGTTLFGTYWQSIGTQTVTAGIDLTGFAFTGNAFASPSFSVDGSGKISSGTAGSVVGKVALANATSGSVTLQPVTGALGTSVISVPAATDTLVGKATTDTLTNKTFDTGGTGNSFSVAGTAAGTVAQLQSVVNSGQYRVVKAAVNFNSATTDTSVTIPLPTGVTRYGLNAIRISNASASISTATIGVFTSTGGGGVTVAANQAITVTATAADTNNNMMAIALTNNATTALSDATLQIRIGTAQGSAATADVILYIIPLS